MNKIILLIIISTISFSYEKGYIDMHGSNSNSLIQNKVDFARKSLDYLLNKKSNKIKDSNNTKLKFIKIDDIESF